MMHRAMLVSCVGLVLAATPITFKMSPDGMAALAAKGGNGGGNGGGNAGSGGNGSGGSGSGAAKGDGDNPGRDSAPGQNKQDGVNAATGKGQSAGGNDASTFGKLNGFMNASPTALTHASVKSPVGAIARVYAGVLGGYLSVDQAKASPNEIDAAQEKLESAAMTLAGIANKPLSEAVVARLNSRIGDLAKQNKLPGGDSTTNAALSKLSSEDPTQMSKNAVLAATIAQMARNSIAAE